MLLDPENLRIGLIGCVWVAGRDGRWHTVGEIAKRLEYSPEDVETILDFLTKYGFAKQSFGLLEKRYQLTVDGPSPMETATMLVRARVESSELSRIVRLYA